MCMCLVALLHMGIDSAAQKNAILDFRKGKVLTLTLYLPALN